MIQIKMKVPIGKWVILSILSITLRMLNSTTLVAASLNLPFANNRLFEAYWLFTNQPNHIECGNIDVIKIIFQYYVRLRVNWWSFEDYCDMYKRRDFAIAVDYGHLIVVSRLIYLNMMRLW